MEKAKVVITGFGPFGEHKINASWEAVKLLQDIEDERIEIITAEIPVTYSDVQWRVKDLWEMHTPKLVVHVGVSSLAHKITIESEANRTGYNKLDAIGMKHPTGECCVSNAGRNTIQSGLNIQNISEELNFIKEKDISCISTDAGRFLCEFTFYHSLCINYKRTLFVHVPTLDNPFSAKELAEALLLIIKVALKQMEYVSE